MGARERPPAQPPVGAQAAGVHVLHDRRGLAVPQLADVEVALIPVQARDALPAEEDVAGGLHEALPLDDAVAVVAEAALDAERALEHGRAGLLGLEDERVAVVAALEQDD